MPVWYSWMEQVFSVIIVQSMCFGAFNLKLNTLTWMSLLHWLCHTVSQSSDQNVCLSWLYHQGPCLLQTDPLSVCKEPLSSLPCLEKPPSHPSHTNATESHATLWEVYTIHLSSPTKGPWGLSFVSSVRSSLRNNSTQVVVNWYNVEYFTYCKNLLSSGAVPWLFWMIASECNFHSLPSCVALCA